MSVYIQDSLIDDREFQLMHNIDEADMRLESLKQAYPDYYQAVDKRDPCFTPGALRRELAQLRGEQEWMPTMVSLRDLYIASQLDGIPEQYQADRRDMAELAFDRWWGKTEREARAKGWAVGCDQGIKWAQGKVDRPLHNPYQNKEEHQ